MSNVDMLSDAMEQERFRKRHSVLTARLARVTHFSVTELQSLVHIYALLTKTDPMDRKRFGEIMHTAFDMTSDSLMERIFSTLCAGPGLVISMENWIIGLSMMLRGTLEEKIKFVFQHYAPGKVDRLGRCEAAFMTATLPHEGAQSSQTQSNSLFTHHDVLMDNVEVYDIMGDGYMIKETMYNLMHKALVKSPGDEDVEEGVRDMVDVICRKLDLDRDGKVSFQDFRTSCLKTPLLLEALGECIPSRSAMHAFLSTFTSNTGHV